MSGVTVPVNQIVIERSAWPRSGLDQDRVAQFAALYTDGGSRALPPLEVIGLPDGRLLLADRWHRMKALRSVGIEEATAVVCNPGCLAPEEFAFRRGLETCTTAALPLNRNERRAAVERLLRQDPSMTDVALAHLAGVSHQTVGRVRRRISNGQQPPSQQQPATDSGGDILPTPEEVAMLMATRLVELWDSRGPGMALGLWETSGLGDHLARAFVKTTGLDDALVWTERFRTWANRAHQVVSQHQRRTRR